MDADTTLQILRDIIAGNDHKHSASDRSEALRIFLADVTHNSSTRTAGDFSLSTCPPHHSQPRTKALRLLP